ncbi:hypothetical protein ACIREO_23685 [Streptomyces sp. NPDC102441]|uniref:hypothetical protein n=1 Tax=Streptomyces sp. NPDC102441 TaxID=3366176 RepID=UPI0037FC754C
MTQHPVQRRQLRSRRLLSSLQWLIVGHDHRLARTRYGVRESASERANRLEKAADRARQARRQRHARRAAREGQQWEDSVYASWAARLPPATAPAPLPADEMSPSSKPVAQDGSSLPALPPGFAPAAAEDHQHHQRADGLTGQAGLPGPDAGPAAAVDGSQREFRRPTLYLVGGAAPTPRPTELRRPDDRATGTRAGGR